MTELTTRQREILDYIKTTVAARGYPPAVREIGEAVGLSSPSTVHSHLSTLVRHGYLKRDPSKPRAIEVVDGSQPAAAAVEPPGVRHVPLVGAIAAGSPILADEEIQDVFALPQQFVGSGPVFMLEVKGDSMIDAGIFSGDYVIVEQTKDARDGQIVAALVDQETATVKRLERKDGVVVLHAENPAFDPMVFTNGVDLLGVVVAVMRSLR